MSYCRYLEAEHRINEGLIRRSRSEAQEGKRPADPDAKMAEMRRFLAALGHPEKGIPAVHVTGTSGKGSVAAAVAGVLTEAGFKVGLHVSPYLQVATEKIWIAGRLVSAEELADLVDWVMPVAAPRVLPETPASIHGMASVAIALEAFRRHAVDIIVFEAGAGGRFDLSNFLDTEVAVVTNVGFDHVVSLGPSLEQIAWHKAGIARPGKPMITGASGASLEVIRREAAAVGAPLNVVPLDEGPLAQNAALAREAARRAAGVLGRPLSEDTISRGLGRIVLPGRSEVMPGPGPRVVLDGAHNSEKLAVAVDAALLEAGAGPRVCLFGLLNAKASPDTVAPLKGRFDHIVVTEPRVYAKQACPAETTAALLAELGCRATVVKDENQALDTARRLATGDGFVLVTGSFYLVGNLRGAWFPRNAVVCERTSFPRQALRHTPSVSR
jgi:dihydrofolate synthase / folylpolyglutamate synthase